MRLISDTVESVPNQHKFGKKGPSREKLRFMFTMISLVIEEEPSFSDALKGSHLFY
jgi:hypothetical protein